jgi:hypothetical protein
MFKLDCHNIDEAIKGFRPGPLHTRTHVRTHTHARALHIHLFHDVVLLIELLNLFTWLPEDNETLPLLLRGLVYDEYQLSCYT